jgi:hypothetical protein
MCLSVNKAIENVRESLSGLLEARQDMNIKTDRNNDKQEEAVEEKAFISDRLAQMTQLTRQLFIDCKNKATQMQKSTLYK